MMAPWVCVCVCVRERGHQTLDLPQLLCMRPPAPFALDIVSHQIYIYFLFIVLLFGGLHLSYFYIYRPIADQQHHIFKEH